MSAAVVTTLGSVAGALLLLAGVLYTQRAGRQTAVESAWKDLNGGLQKELARVNARCEANEEKIGVLERKVEGLVTFRHLAVEYIRALLASLKRANIDPPDPPPGLDLE